MVIYRRWDLLMFLESLSKCSGGFSYIFFITLHPVTFVPVDDSTLLQYKIFVLWSHQEVLDGIAFFNMDLHSMCVACSLDAFTQSFVIWHHYVWILVALLAFCIAVIAVLLVSLAGVLILVLTLLNVECPRCLPVGEYIASIEQASTQLNKGRWKN